MDNYQNLIFKDENSPSYNSSISEPVILLIYWTNFILKNKNKSTKYQAPLSSFSN